MGLPLLRTACVVLDLKTGNLVVGCLNAVFSFSMLVTLIVSAAQAGAAAGAVEAAAAAASVPPDPEEAAARTGLVAMTVILVIMFLAKLVFDIAFIIGVVYERRGMVKAYVIAWIVFFLLSAFTFFVNVLRYDAATVVAMLLYLGFNVYVVLLGRSFYHELNTREEL